MSSFERGIPYPSLLASATHSATLSDVNSRQNEFVQLVERSTVDGEVTHGRASIDDRSDRSAVGFTIGRDPEHLSERRHGCLLYRRVRGGDE